MYFMTTRHRPSLPEVLSYDLRVSVWSEGIPFRVDGTLDIRNPYSTPLQRLTLYLHPELRLTSASSEDGCPIEIDTQTISHDWSYTKSLSAHSLVLAEPIEARGTRSFHLAYEGAFSPCGLRSPSDFMRIDDEGAYLRGLGYSLWFPVSSCDEVCEASVFRIQLDVPLAWRGVAFGNLKQMETSGGRSLSTWETSSPFKHLQAQLFASPFTIFEGTHLSVFAKEESREGALKLTAFGDRLLDSFASSYGALDGIPHSYLVETCPYGCIASGNVVGLAPEVFRLMEDSAIDFETYDLIAHEFVHGYVTPWIDRSSPGAALLLEGFPSYFHVPTVTDILGDDYHEWFFQRAWQSYRRGLKQQADMRRSTSVLIDKPLLGIGINEIPQYKDAFLLSDKLPIVLDQLRRRVGAAAFLSASKEFFAEGRRKPVAIANFFRLLEIYSEQDLSHFVARWVDSIRPLPESWEQAVQSE
jgi:hypothetical protein